MNFAPGRRLDAILLRRQSYRTVPVNSSLSGHVAELHRALEDGVRAYPDWQRPDFYDVELENAWAYIHLREDARAVYLVAYSSSAAFIPSQPGSPETNREGIDENVHG